MYRLTLLALLFAGPAFAHEGHEHGPGWTLSASVTLPLALIAILYVLGWARLRRRSERGRAGLARNAAMFVAGWLVLAMVAFGLPVTAGLITSRCLGLPTRNAAGRGVPA